MGSIPQQLFKYIDGKNMRDATDEFIGFINNISLQLHTRLYDIIVKHLFSGRTDAELFINYPQKGVFAFCKSR